ncbi:MAG: Zinc finger CCHC domain-containing protein 8 [Marteilia pararefringens]
MIDSPELKETSRCTACQKCDEIANIVSLKCPDILVTYYNTDFGKFLHERMPSMIENEIQKFNRINSSSSAEGSGGQEFLAKFYYKNNYSMQLSSNSHSTNLKDNIKKEEQDSSISCPMDDLYSKFSQIKSNSLLTSDFDSILDYEVSAKEASGTENKSKIEIDESHKSKCFNCDKTDHQLSECPLPPNKQKINSNKQQFRNAQDGQQKRMALSFSEPLPSGQISQGLQAALGIQGNQLPPYIYQMRRFGYPPGWLKYAENISLQFDGIVLDKKLPKYDAEKLISYPGFNAPLRKRQLDESHVYNVKRYDDKRHSLQAMVAQLERENQKCKVNSRTKPQNPAKSPEATSDVKVSNDLKADDKHEEAETQSIYIFNSQNLSSTPDISKFASNISPFEKIEEQSLTSSKALYKEMRDTIRQSKLAKFSNS